MSPAQLPSPVRASHRAVSHGNRLQMERVEWDLTRLYHGRYTAKSQLSDNGEPGDGLMLSCLFPVRPGAPLHHMQGRKLNINVYYEA